MLKEFREFALRGNVWDMAIGIIIGAAFTPIAKSLVDDVLMPPIGLLIGDVDFGQLYFTLKTGDPAGPYATIEAAREAKAVVIAYGSFINTLITFLVVAFAVFLLVKAVNRMRRADEEAPPEESVSRSCDYCKLNIPLEATRCPNCTSELDAFEPAG
jgi:large conductance mechanosensitive channel